MKSIGIVLTMLLSIYLIGIVNNCEAASITYLNVTANTDYGSGGEFYASLSANENISYIDWYVKHTYPLEEDEVSEYKHVLTSMHHSGTKSVYVYLGSFDGNIKIAEYDIKAVATFTDAENNTSSDTSTTLTSVYKPHIAPDSGEKETGVYGYSELTAHYYDGSYIVMDGYACLYNNTDDDATGSGRFRHTALNKGLDELEQPLPISTFPSGQAYGYSTSDWGTYFNFFAGDLRDTDSWECNAYLRIEVQQGNEKEDWLAQMNNTFDRNDYR
ncbi:hypothetical protein C6497_10230 [Candidatus Poribacteria bacterium]|nr:MAG: hypothetical protein C6497_10230 [Candidatus Poribacteria bacterium]